MRSMSLMALSIENNTLSLEDISKQIDPLEAQLLRSLSTAEMKTFKNDIASSSKEWERHITGIKSKKFQWDTNDAANNRIYMHLSGNPPISGPDSAVLQWHHTPLPTVI